MLSYCSSCRWLRTNKRAPWQFTVTSFTLKSRWLIHTPSCAQLLTAAGIGRRIKDASDQLRSQFQILSHAVSIKLSYQTLGSFTRYTCFLKESQCVSSLYQVHCSQRRQQRKIIQLHLHLILIPTRWLLMQGTLLYAENQESQRSRRRAAKLRLNLMRTRAAAARENVTPDRDVGIVARLVFKEFVVIAVWKQMTESVIVCIVLTMPWMDSDRCFLSFQTTQNSQRLKLCDLLITISGHFLKCSRW